MVLASLAQQTPIDQVVPLMFYAVAALTVISAWAVAISQNVIRMAVYLLLTLAGVACLYFMLNAEFLAAIQLIIYAGGTLILIVFAVMLTGKNPFIRMTIGWSAAKWFLRRPSRGCRCSGPRTRRPAISSRFLWG